MTKENGKDANSQRHLLLLCAGLYLLWWVLVRLFLPRDFNPLGSRLAVVTLCACVWAASFRSAALRRRLPLALGACVWLITLHFFYLFYANGGGQNWVVGSFVTVLAATFVLSSRVQLGAYSLFVGAGGAVLAALLPTLGSTIFLPGIATILLQANISLAVRARTLGRLRESIERFQRLFNSTTEGLLLLEDRRITAVNQALLQMLGHPADFLIGTDIHRLLRPEAPASGEIDLRGLVGQAREIAMPRRDGSLAELETRAKEIDFEGTKLLLLTFRDLTDRKRAETDRAAALAMAARVRALDEFITLASHELKTPVTSLKLWLQLLERELGGSREQPARPPGEIAALMAKQVTRLSVLIETMLNTSQLTTGRLILTVERLDFTDIVRQAMEEFGPESARAQTPFHLTAPGPLFVKGDPTRLGQIVRNLLSNGIKYGDRQPVTLTLFREGDSIVFRVQDEGLGIEPGDLARIFDRFERAGPTANISGLGLGLFLVKSLVEAHGGSIGVESTPGRSSIFTVRLPAA